MTNGHTVTSTSTNRGIPVKRTPLLNIDVKRAADFVEVSPAETTSFQNSFHDDSSFSYAMLSLQAKLVSLLITQITKITN